MNKLFSSRRLSLGFTLVELLVALAISTVIALAAIGILTASQQGFRTVDVASQLRDNARFATSIIQRLVLQAGFLDTSFAVETGARTFKMAGAVAIPEPNIVGFDDANFNDDLVLDFFQNTVGSYNDSDMLVVRYQVSEVAPGVNDNGMIDCVGKSPSVNMLSKNDRALSVFYIRNDAGEPSLMCAYQASGGDIESEPLVKGVETMQILYGVDGVTPNSATTVAGDSVPERYLTAKQLTVPGNKSETAKNWARVRTVRVALVIRGPANSALETAVPALQLFGPMISSSYGAGNTDYTFPAKSDGRFRQVVNFTLHLRNDQATL